MGSLLLLVALLLALLLELKEAVGCGCEKTPRGMQFTTSFTTSFTTGFATRVEGGRWVWLRENASKPVVVVVQK